jgi:IMP dehydrogenase/GMP reductase
MMRNEENNMTNFKMTANMTRVLAMATMHMDRADRPTNYKGQPVTVANSSNGRNYEGYSRSYQTYARHMDTLLDAGFLIRHDMGSSMAYVTQKGYEYAREHFADLIAQFDGEHTEWKKSI